ncbi:DNA methylase [Brevibacterium iodinum]|uniref:hypothetical protein n=1 Tax=Brevibacterium iodinum TaxID=31943 RepID=UPI000E14659E|nr:hypothetical protein [Brevibacterium iodinum]SUW70183.1 DNA methylase [Brevibacterium iodinum]
MTGQKEGPVTDTSHVQEEADGGDGQEVTGPVFRMDMGEEYVPSGPKARFQANVAAIERVRSLTETGRTATGQDQEVLAGWSSWGAVADVFDETKSNWAAEREQLRELLTEDEWEAARATTINAHYTAPAIVGEMWSALQKLGLNEGKVLEPGCGSGNFIGTAPDSMDMVGIELDPISAQVAGYLYPNAEVRNESFGKTLVRPDQFDATIANVPFGNFPVFDPSWNPGERFSIHNYFIRKAVGGLHEGGIGVMMTSAFTMDSQNPAFRAEISREADLLGAVRLPNGTHRRTAGTEVVTDVLVFRKRMEGEEPTPETLRWVKSTPTQIGNAGGRLLLNRYFQDHPENVLGELEISTFRDTQIDVKTDNLAAVPEQLRDRLAAIVDAAEERGRTYVAPSPEVLAAREQSVAVDLNPGQWPGTLLEREPESFVRVIDGETVEVKVPKNAMDEVRSLMDLRDRASALIEGQVATPVDTEELVALREETREVWAKHVERFGPINRHRTRWQTKIVRNDDTGEKERVRVQVRVDPTPAKIMRDDPLWSLTKALEIYNDETEEAVAADVLHQRTVEQNRPLLGADTAEEALDCAWMLADGRNSTVSRICWAPTKIQHGRNSVLWSSTILKRLAWLRARSIFQGTFGPSWRLLKERLKAMTGTRLTFKSCRKSSPSPLGWKTLPQRLVRYGFRQRTTKDSCAILHRTGWQRCIRLALGSGKSSMVVAGARSRLHLNGEQRGCRSMTFTGSCCPEQKSQSWTLSKTKLEC